MTAFINNWDQATHSAAILTGKTADVVPWKLAKLSVLQDEWSGFQGRKRDILLIYTHAHVWCASSIPRIPSSAPAILKSSSFFSLPSLVSLSTLAFCVLSREMSLPYACLFITCSAWTFPAPAPWQPSQSMEHVLFVAPKLLLVPTQQKCWI